MRGNRGRPGLLPVGVGNGVIIPPMDRAGNQIRNDQNAAAPIPIIAAKRAIPTGYAPMDRVGAANCNSGTDLNRRERPRAQSEIRPGRLGITYWDGDRAYCRPRWRHQRPVLIASAATATLPFGRSPTTISKESPAADLLVERPGFADVVRRSAEAIS